MIWIVILVAFLWPAHLTPEDFTELWIWNVGQGLWVTESSPDKCRHFDAGGESMSWKSLWRLCRSKRNEIFLSHGDWDHIRWVPTIASRLGKACLRNRPHHGVSLWKSRHLAKVPDCQEPDTTGEVAELHSPKNPANANQSSRVYLLRDKVLLPGDSPISEERKWAKALSEKQIKILILGHHGSHTSTSYELLAKLRHLKMAVASSRRAKYRHPHCKTLKRLRKSGVPVLKTEDLGHIRFRL